MISIKKGVNSGFYWDILEVLNQVTREVARENQICLIDLARGPGVDRRRGRG